jgi:long-subunit fatty acid transport protein
MPGRGVGPLGRGGAVVALGGDLNGIWYNPGVLGVLEGHVLLIDAALTHLSASHQRAPGITRSGEPISYAEVESSAAPLPIPQLLFGSSLWEGSPMVVAAGVYAPSAAAMRFPERGPQRYAMIDNTQSLIIYQHLAVAWRAHPRLSVGVGVQNISAVVDSSVMGSAYIGLWGEPEDQDLDVLLNVRATDYISITGNMGAWAEPIDGLQVGVSAQLPAQVRDDAAALKVRLPSHYAFDGARVEGDTVGVSVQLPWIIRGGMRYVVPGVFDVEVDVYGELWSALQEVVTNPAAVRVTGAPLVGDIALGPLNLPRRYRDILGVSVGGGWWAIPEVLYVQAGFMYEQGAIPDATFSAFQFDSDKYAPTLGAQWRVTDTLALDFSYAHIFHAKRTVTHSEIKQVNPAFAEGAVVVGNGTYSARYDIVGLGLRLGL